MIIDTQVIAHRGATAYAPENTLAAFNRAKAMGAEWIECDIMLSQDGEAFIFHDETLQRTTNGRGKFGQVSSEYIKTLDAGSWFSKAFTGERIPTLKEALLWFATHDIKVNIEIKPFPGFMQETTLALLQHMNLYWPDHRGHLLVSSFDIDALRLCRQLEPELSLSLLLDTWQDDVVSCAEELGCVSVNLYRKIATYARVEQLKEANLTVCVFTVNRKREALRYFKWGVTAVYSDYPDLLEKALTAKFLKNFWIKKTASPRIISV